MLLERRARSGVSYLVRHKMRRAILPFPNRGYQTANPDGVLGGLNPKPKPVWLERSSPDGSVEQRFLLFGSHP